MFYTLVSRTVITKINTPRDYFYIFLIGSIGYVILHWYLHMEQREGIVEKIREYLYYAMVIDVVTAYIWMMLSPVKSDKETEDKEDTKNRERGNEQYTPEEKKMIMQRMQEARRLQQMRQKELAEHRMREGGNDEQDNKQHNN